MHLNDIHQHPDIAIIRERFERFVMPEPNSGCSLWLGAIDKDGYGKFRIDGFDFRAHRVGRALSGLSVEDLPLLHECDMPACVCERHTFHGTHVENIADKMRKGRQAKGEMQGNSSLTASEVTEIYLSHEKQVDDAARYGVSQAHISRIRRAEIWMHITGPLLLAYGRGVDCRKRSV